MGNLRHRVSAAILCACACIVPWNSDAQTARGRQPVRAGVGTSAQIGRDNATARMVPHASLFDRWQRCVAEVSWAATNSGKGAADTAQIAFAACEQDAREFQASLAREIGFARSGRVLAAEREKIAASLMRAQQPSPAKDPEVYASVGFWRVQKVKPGTCFIFKKDISSDNRDTLMIIKEADKADLTLDFMHLGQLTDVRSSLVAGATAELLVVAWKGNDPVQMGRLPFKLEQDGKVASMKTTLPWSGVEPLMQASRLRMEGAIWGMSMDRFSEAWPAFVSCVGERS